MQKTIDGQNKAPRALLLLGPTGSGKTPLGELLASHGTDKPAFRHFDFGAHLRKVAESSWSAGLGQLEISIVRDCLEKGALLENETFEIAAKILAAFVKETFTDNNDLLVLNGLPRHVNQARMLQDLVNVRNVVVLECEAATAYERIRLNSGGDRKERRDDEMHAIAKRLNIYQERTLPLIDYYESCEAGIIRLPVGVSTSAEELVKQIML